MFAFGLSFLPWYHCTLYCFLFVFVFSALRYDRWTQV